MKNENDMLDVVVDKIGDRIIYGISSIEEAKENVFYILNSVKNGVEQRLGANVLSNVSYKMNDIMAISVEKELTYFFENELHKISIKLNDWKFNNTKRIVLNALNFIDENFCSDINLDEVAMKLNVSAFYLSKIIKKETGRNFSDIITEKRIEKAKELLKTDMNVKEVTYKCGFNSQNYFTKIFKKEVGLTPTDYKNY